MLIGRAWILSQSFFLAITKIVDTQGFFPETDKVVKGPAASYLTF
jgi:hypothetical protein